MLRRKLRLHANSFRCSAQHEVRFIIGTGPPSWRSTVLPADALPDAAPHLSSRRLLRRHRRDGRRTSGGGGDGGRNEAADGVVERVDERMTSCGVAASRVTGEGGATDREALRVAAETSVD